MTSWKRPRVSDAEREKDQRRRTLRFEEKTGVGLAVWELGDACAADEAKEALGKTGFAVRKEEGEELVVESTIPFVNERSENEEEKGKERTQSCRHEEQSR
jgi:hypothetical protein